MSMAHQVAQYLQAQGLGTLGEDFFVGFQPDTPNDCVTFYDEAAPIYDPSHGLAVDQFGVQVLVRNESYFLANDLTMEIHSHLVAFGDDKFVSDGPEIWVVMLQTNPGSIGKDNQGRNEWSAHYLVRAESLGDI